MVGNFKETTYRSEKYLDFVRTMPCCACGVGNGVQAHHVKKKGLGGMGLKVSDLRSIPLCAEHHEELHRVGPEAFRSRYNVNLSLARAMTMMIYLQRPNDCLNPEDPWGDIADWLEGRVKEMEGRG